MDEQAVHAHLQDPPRPPLQQPARARVQSMPVPSAFYVHPSSAHPATAAGSGSGAGKPRTTAIPTSRQLSTTSNAVAKLVARQGQGHELSLPPYKRQAMSEGTAVTAAAAVARSSGGGSKSAVASSSYASPAYTPSPTLKAEKLIADPDGNALAAPAAPPYPTLYSVGAVDPMLPGHHYRCIHEYGDAAQGAYPIPPIPECPYQPFISDTSLKCHLLDCYFTFAHSQTPVIHKSSFLQGMCAGMPHLGGYAHVPQASPQPWEGECSLLLYAMFAMGAIYSDDPYVCINPTKR
jgi:hypothetical protein